ncbi:MAG: four-carbon acid sugar kinase family protein [Solidesulfovibrio sp.]
MNTKIAVIADDLTGANDTGVQFAKQGVETAVLLGLHAAPGALEAQAVVADTQSRALSPDQAYERSAQAAALFKNGPARVLYKKVDSTLRGNLGPEIEAIMDAFGLELAVVAPSFPKLGRSCVGGYVLLQGVPLEATEIARDPKCPVDETHLPTLLSRQVKRGVGHAGIKDMLAGEQALAARLKEHLAQGRSIVVCDVWKEEHFPLILAAGLSLNVPVLWVGSAGLAEHLPRALGIGPSGPASAPALVVAGSVSSVTRTQVAYLKKRPQIAAIEVDPQALLLPETREREVERCFALAAKAAAEGHDVVVASGYSEEVVANTTKRAGALGMSAAQAAEEVALGLGQLCRKLTLESAFCGLVLTGGDTAVSCCLALKATAFTVVSEVAAGIPLGELQGGDADGMPMVTKAGAFGSEDALALAMDTLKSMAAAGRHS